MTEEKCLDDLGYKRYAERFQRIIDKGKKEYNYPLDPQNESFRNNLNKCMITKIDPALFTALAAPKCWFREGSVDYLWDKFENQHNDLYPLYLDINPVTCQISGHEGRHRAEIARDLGIKEVPLKLCFIHREIFKIKGKQFAGYESNLLREKIRDEGFSYELVEKWLKDNNAYWEEPEECGIDDVKGQVVHDVVETWDKTKALREQYGIDELRKEWWRLLSRR